MHFINTETLQLETFASEDGVKYAILSHRWQEPHEVLFQNMKSLVVAEQKRGFAKLQRFCVEASRRGFPYAWVDTCCIDKDSSAELSEAINSMFRLYSNAVECYAYLHDVDAKAQDIAETFPKTEWFQRGWTLQELLAPKRLVVFDQLWNEIGTKDSLRKMIYEATGISEAALAGQDVLEFSVATRMSWAAQRKTTRIEDRAYSLMGLFNVNMPMLYGEGEKAFLRLQEEIIKYSTDQTIFAWSQVPEEGSGLLAGSLDCFRHCGNIKEREDNFDEPATYQMTNRGLSITLSLTPWAFETFAARLSCRSIDGNPIMIFLRRLGSGQYKRIRVGGVDISDRFAFMLKARETRECPIHVRQDGLNSSITKSIPFISNPTVYGFKIIPGDSLELKELDVISSKWDSETGIAQSDPGDFGALVTIDLRKIDTQIAVIKLGFNFDFEPRCVVAGCHHSDTYSRNFGSKHNPGGLKWPKSIEDVTCTEAWDYVQIPIKTRTATYGESSHVERLIFDKHQPDGYHQSSVNLEHCDLWAFEVLNNSHTSILRRSDRNSLIGSLGEKEAGKLTFEYSFVDSQFVWAITLNVNRTPKKYLSLENVFQR